MPVSRGGAGGGRGAARGASGALGAPGKARALGCAVGLPAFSILFTLFGPQQAWPEGRVRDVHVALCLYSSVLVACSIAWGSHRYFAHRTFRVSRLTQFLIALWGTSA